MRAVTTLDAAPLLSSVAAASDPAPIAGDYVDSWYGPITIRLSAPNVRVNFVGTPGMTCSLRFVRNSTYAVTWHDATIEPADMNFACDHVGRVAQITTAAISPLADSSFDYHDLLFHPKNHPRGAEDFSAPPPPPAPHS